MRPAALDPLFASAATLPGVGPRVAESLARLCGRESADAVRVKDVLFHLPTGVIDRGFMPAIADLPPSGVVTVRARVRRHLPPAPGSRSPWRVEVSDGTGTLTLVYFHPRPDWIRQILPEGEERCISGAVEWFRDQPQMPHPDHVIAPEEFARLPRLEPTYPLTAGLSRRMLGRIMQAALARLPHLPEWLDPAMTKARGWPAFSEALRRLHEPEEAADIAPDSPLRQRLAYDELLASQLALALVRYHARRARGRALAGTGRLRQAIEAALPYTLTPAQRQAIEEITADMAAPERMLRLLQGDVGSGKTVVALMAMATAAEANAQSALMAPSDILARQHHAAIAPLAAAAGLRTVLLTGRDSGRARQEKLRELATGEAHIAIGTHALFQKDVIFRDLGLVVVDEQHRFGVRQRLALQAKGDRADLLVMTATPIPRTLALTAYGDLDVSRITERPAGRRPVKTSVLPLARLPEVTARLKTALEEGARAYWVCPLVEDSGALPHTAAEERFAMLSKLLPGRVGLVHGRMKGEERDAVMADFRAGRISVLVATTVIEVGVDVPEATIMIIENAERFGLAQLHQLRGRVGRGNRESYCLLLYREPLSATARERLRIMRETDDGFVIAEADLRLRGAGDLLGERQAGMPQFLFADPARHEDLLLAARDDARLIISRDPALASSRGQALRHLLYLFERNEAIRLLLAG
jgi:ATP-dependent DNA helicase RecG